MDTNTPVIVQTFSNAVTRKRARATIADLDAFGLRNLLSLFNIEVRPAIRDELCNPHRGFIT